MMPHKTVTPIGSQFLFFVALLVCLSLPAGVAAADSAKDIIDAAGVQGGLIVHLGCGTGERTAKLHLDNRYLVQGLDTDPSNVQKARDYLQSRGIYGDVSVDRFDGRHLPYVDNLVNLMVVEKQGDVSVSELMRVLAPEGVACIRQEGTWKKVVKPRPEDIDDWTHYLHDGSGNAVAADQEVGPPKHVRWIAGPLWSRSHEFNPSINALVSAKGRMFYILDEGIIGLPDLRFPARWSLMARDAFSGKFLWKRPMQNWGYREWNTRGMWSAPLTLNRRVVTDGDRVYVTFGYKSPLSVLDAITGRTIHTIADTMGTDEIILSDGTLLLCVRDHLSVASPPKPNEAKKRRRRHLNPHEWTIDAPGPASIVAVDAETGRIVWRNEPEPVTVLTLAALNGQVCFLGSDGITCLDLKTGKKQWTTRTRPVKGSRHSGGTLVMHENVVLFTSADGLTAFSAADGKKLWTGPKLTGPAISHPPDLFVADGLVWGGYLAGSNRKDRTEVQRTGFDLRTGEVKRTIDVANLFSPLHHVRCYRSKATDRYLLLPKRGVEFLDLNGNNHMRNDWLRAMCHYGTLPCNGLLYVPPSHCFCYPGVKMTGFLALAGSEAGSEARGKRQEAKADDRLEQGPATLSALDPRPSTLDSSFDWPTYRRDNLRSGHTESTVPVTLKSTWVAKLGGKITPPVLASGKIYVAQIDAHRVCCLDAQSGQMAWSFTAGARVDSPPTIYRGLVLFGCRDGWVYCLRANDGQLVWRYRAAPADRRIVAFDQLESVWPVPGSVLMLDDVAYVSAGRSSFLDGGVYLYGLDPRTGELLYQTCVKGPWPDVDKDVGRPFDMDGTKSDILVTDGKNLFLFQMAFDKTLHDVTAPRASTLGDRKCGRHLMATGGFLDRTWFDRLFWTYSDRWPGFYYANAAPKAGQILVFDDKTTYGVHVFTKRLRLSPAFTPGTNGYELFADANDNEPILASKSRNREKGPGFSRTAPPLWSSSIPVRVQAMVLADDKLVVAGPPDVVPEDDPYAAFDGRLGAKLWIVAADDGRKLAEYPLDSLPVVDGLISVSGRLYLSTADGKLRCFAEQ